ncbi:molybdate ABC transporter substrate-binding protein [Shewanella sp. 202IG2-18]|uniref:molybdate ABC transporter substrate-binding protein n=1 Tax=Parashewanella hymeniacidonis TaxID=2807618 RepID=UPI001961B18D|nr:molybdate ABC transporter substrate-binding protein [Parashewanella hymeniacidonis]MBM7071738.1 molybdate ABC transporter substrate-binding protein [Parashewanella hymeniacidonis]
MNMRRFNGNRLVWFYRLFIAVFALTFSATSLSQQVPPIAAAANVRFAMNDIAKQFTQQSGMQIRLSYGSSGQLVQQIKHGAPFQLFISADQHYVDWLTQQGLTQGQSVIYAIGRLALVKAKDSPLTLDPELQGVSRLLTQGKLSRFAIANPEHAPYGLAAKQALEHQGLWKRLHKELIMGENVGQAAQFALSNATQGAIIALSLAKAPNYSSKVDYVALAPELHQPLHQAMVLTNKADSVAKKFFLFLQSQTAQDTLRKYGFDIPTLKSH